MNHASLTAVHVPTAATYADAAARAAATGFPRGEDSAIVAFDSSDVGKLARQSDDNSIWMLTDDSPVTWVQVAGASIPDGLLGTSYIKADGTRAFTGNQSMGSHKLTNVTDPASAQDAATKAYVDALLAASDAVVYKGVTDCSGNPNYPAADAGHLYIVSVAGKIG